MSSDSNTHTGGMDKEAILNAHLALLQRTAASYEANVFVREELLQDMLESVWLGLDRFRGEAKVTTYVMRIAHNRGAHHVARACRTRRSEAVLSENEKSVADPLHLTTVGEQRERLYGALRTLALADRQLLMLWLENLSYRDMAEVTGMPVNRVGVRLNRARNELKRLLGDGNEE